jgi:hypothetical protein
MIPWEHEGVFALITDAKMPNFIEATPAPPDASTSKRVAHFALSVDGTLEGDVEQTATGHEAAEVRGIAKERSAAQMEEAVHDATLREFPDAEVTNVKVENADDVTKPFTVRYHLKAPLYAQVTSKRVLFQPNPFERSAAAKFSASERKLRIEFEHAWKEMDEIHIQLPDGFELDNAESPGGFDFGDPGKYNLQIAIRRGEHQELTTTRELTFGEGGRLFFPVTSYATLKKVFDQIQVRDSHTLSLIQKGATN